MLLNVDNLKFRLIFTISAIIFLLQSLSACGTTDYSKYATLSTYDRGSKRAFSLVVKGDFAKKIPKDDYNENKHISNSEIKILEKLLKQNKYCLNKDGKLSFVVLWRQDEIYDVTFADLVVQSYNARALTPLTYFGECVL